MLPPGFCPWIIFITSSRLFQCLSNQDTILGQFVNVFFMVYPYTLSTGHGLLCLQQSKEHKRWRTNTEMITFRDPCSPLPSPKMALILGRQFTLLPHTNSMVNNPHRLVWFFSHKLFTVQLFFMPYSCTCHGWQLCF